jgi:hypothetical protein
MSAGWRVIVFSIFISTVFSSTASARFGPWWQQPTPPEQPLAEPPTQPPVEPPITEIPQPDADPGFESTHFSGSANCNSCHDGLRDQNGRDVSINSEWSASMMANAARDPVFHAKFASEVKRNPELAPVLSKKCLHCHAPMASFEADFDGEELTLLSDTGILDPANPYHDEAMEGVSCTVCHQIEDSEDLGEEGSFSGGFKIPTVGESSSRVSYGQYQAPFVNLMRRETGITPKHSRHMADSAVCGTCHNLKTPVVDGNGEVVSNDTGHEFPEQAVYSEWQHSDSADEGSNPQSCQDCHMQSADGVRMATRPRRLSRVDDFKRHGFSGANTVVMDILDSNRTELGVTSQGLDDAIVSSREFLKSAAEIKILSAVRVGKQLEVDIQVINRTGHKLPTGYPSRRVWIDFQVLKQNGEQVFRSGRMNADGSIAGVDSDAVASQFEPHRQVIDNENQVQVYESIMGDTDGALTYTLLRAADYLKDNRIPPSGFDKAEVPDDIAVIGNAYDDSDFGDGSDRVTYSIDVPDSGSLRIVATLRYQPLAGGFLNDLFRDSELPLVARMQGYWDRANIRAETLASEQLTIGR